MDTVVEIIPLLLHGSLLFFFAGLVAFLQPINTLVTAVTATILGTVTMIYASLTLVPLFHSDCPYRTPLSGGFWNLRKSLQIIFRRKRASTATMMEGVLSAATIPSTERDLRDDAALVWTVKSLTDTPELEPLIEALPDVLWGTDSRRHLYDRHIHRMIEDPGSDLLARVRDFRHNCHSRGLPVEVAKRHQISYYKAIWALGSLSTPGCAVQIPVPHLSQIDPQVAPYYSSARAIQAWADLCAAKTLLDSTLALLATYIRTAAAHRVPLIGRIHSSLQQLHSVYHLTFSDSGMFDLALGLPPAETLSVAAQSITDEITNLPLSVLLGYLAGFKSNGIPYRFDATQRLLSPPPSTTVSTRMLPVVESALYDIVRYNLTSIKEEEGIVSLDTVFGKVISYWEPRQGPFPWAVVEYLGTRKCDEAVRRALLLVPERAWQRLPDTILAGGSDHTSAVLNTIWRICAERLRSGPSWKFGDLATWEATLEAVWETGQRSPTPAVFAIVKHVILQQLERTLDALVGQDVVLRSNEPLRLTLSFSLAPECIVPDGASEEEMRTILRCRYALAELDNLTEFLQQCSSGHDALLLLGTTMGMIGEFIPRLGIHPEHQLRFATAVNKLFTQGTATTLLAEFSSLRIWWAYGGEVSRGDAWLDDEQARALVQETLRAYLNTLPLNNDLSAHVRRVVTSMDRLHGQ
ncbi:hypothetical protein C8R46DRAFT_956817 [Mycena filopes]|nr:hypothetical protein C8R46DRAFT_956817 [Mycena filopes]